MNLNKFIFFLKRQKVVVITGRARQTAKEAIFQVLGQHFQIGREIIILESDLKNSADTKKVKFFLQRSQLPILLVTHIGEYHPDREFFAGEIDQISEIVKLAEILPPQGHLVLNFDDETVRDLKNKSRGHSLTFGFGARTDIRATDIVLSLTGTNFKINYEGNIVPVWLERLFGKEHIYAALAAVGVGEILDLNLVEISEALRFYRGLPGKMRLIEGIKNSWILDDSESASPLSMAEALEILRRIEAKNRKIAVLGDILGIGKYTIEAHEAIGERVAKNADLLFTFGPRAKFIAQGAQSKGMALDKIFQFDTIEQGKLKLQEEIKGGDLILVDGSKMVEVVKEI